MSDSDIQQPQNDTVIALKKLVIEAISHSKDMNMEYKLCVDYLNNYKEDKYKELMTSRTGKTAIELYKYAQEFISKTNKWIFHTISGLTEHQQADLMNDTKKMDAFLESVHCFIEKEVLINGVPIFSTKRT